MPAVSASAGSTGRSAGRGLAVARALALRLAQFAVVLLGLGTVLFFVLRMSGDPVVLLLPPDAPPEAYRQLREAMGLDRPLLVQYLAFLEGLARLDFGESLVYRQPALDVVLARLPATLELAAAAVVFSLAVGFPLGALAATARWAPARALPALVAVIGQSMPGYWLGVLLILVFAVRLRLLPASGAETAAALVLPMVTLGMQLAAKVTRLVRAGMRQELRSDYVRTAHSKGLPATNVLWGHALPNMVIPVIAVLAVDIGHLMGGAVITETIFAWPGIGRQLVAAVLARDFPVVQTIVFLVAVLVIAINVSAEAIYRLVDPRLRRA